MKKIKENPNTLVQFPVFIDATCSGIQHIAAMIKDFNIAKNVNLVKQDKTEKVQDIYSILLNYINQAIFIEGNSPETKFPLLKHVSLSRSEIKLPTMTKTYNVSLIGMKNQLTYSLNKRSEINLLDNKSNIIHFNKKIKIKSYLNNENIELDYKDILKIAQIIESSIFENFPFLKSVYDYFKESSKLLNSLGLPLV